MIRVLIKIENNNEKESTKNRLKKNNRKKIKILLHILIKNIRMLIQYF
jgi:hypothetical protein